MVPPVGCNATSAGAVARPSAHGQGTSLAGLHMRGMVQAAYIDRLLDQHRSGHASYYGVMIWVLMMLEQWLEQHEG